MRRIFLVVLVISLLIQNPCPIQAAASGGEVRVLVDGTQIEPDVKARIVNGSTMLPFRAILNALGIEDSQITWRGQSQSIEVRTSSTYIFLVIGSTGALVNGNLIMLNTAPFVVDGRTMIPVRFVSEALGAKVDWDGETRTVTISRPKPTSR